MSEKQFPENENLENDTEVTSSADNTSAASDSISVQEEELPHEPMPPRKRFTAVQTVVISAVCVVLAFMITFLAVANVKDAQFRKEFEELNSKLEMYENQASDMVLGSVVTDEQRRQLFALLLELDTYFNAYEFNEIDYKAITDYVLTAYAAAVGDDYAEYYTEEGFAAMMQSMQGQNQGIGVNIVYDAENNGITVINVMPNSPALNAGVLPGDRIIAVGTGADRELVAELGYTAAVLKLQGAKGTLAEFTVVRDGKEIEFSITRDEYENQSVLWHVYSLDKSVAVVKILNFDALTPAQFKTAMDEVKAAGLKKVVFDVRANPGGNLDSIVEILDRILPEGPIIRIVDKNGKTVEQMDSQASAEYTDMEFAVLVNENTASAAELFTSALMDYDRAVIVGTTTFGKGSMQSTIRLSGNRGVKMTTYHYLPPYSESYDGIGIIPDVSVELDEALKNKNLFLVSDEEDNQLAKAVESLTK